MADSHAVHTAHTTRRKSSDFTAAITGLVVGGCVLFALVFGIVQITNHMYAGEPTAAAAP
ncbi:MAG: hypothetical protein ACR2MQ_12210 [Gemmatimonadaceae bacterium]